MTTGRNLWAHHRICIASRRCHKAFNFDVPDTPGPGDIDVDVQHPRHPAYSLGTKNEFFWATYAAPASGGRMATSSHDVVVTPGPASYGPVPFTAPTVPARPRTTSTPRRGPFGDRPSPGPGHYEARNGFEASSASPRKHRPTTRTNLPPMARAVAPGPQCPPYTQFDDMASCQRPR
mmetsp:Transcript_52476/g.114546  ORF Transcript_52476/g.114546 Transcript_52476/m.114546 type:complete len:177 (+) Transcript_52476:252-782(+)